MNFGRTLKDDYLFPDTLYASLLLRRRPTPFPFPPAPSLGSTDPFPAPSFGSSDFSTAADSRPGADDGLGAQEPTCNAGGDGAQEPTCDAGGDGAQDPTCNAGGSGTQGGTTGELDAVRSPMARRRCAHRRPRPPLPAFQEPGARFAPYPPLFIRRRPTPFPFPPVGGTMIGASRSVAERREASRSVAMRRGASQCVA